MDACLDEDFVDFEAVSQRCSLLLPTADEELHLLDNEATPQENRGKIFEL